MKPITGILQARWRTSVIAFLLVILCIIHTSYISLQTEIHIGYYYTVILKCEQLASFTQGEGNKF